MPLDLKNYATAIRAMTTENLWREYITLAARRRNIGVAADLVAVAATELRRRGLDPTAGPQPPKRRDTGPVHIRPPSEVVIDGSSAIEIWSADKHVATMYCEGPAVRFVFQPGWEPDGHSIAVGVQAPMSLYFGFAHFED
jgi:hypothetical protein